MRLIEEVGAGGLTGGGGASLRGTSGSRGLVLEVVREPFRAYLRSSIGLITQAARELLPGIDPASMDLSKGHRP